MYQMVSIKKNAIRVIPNLECIVSLWPFGSVVVTFIALRKRFSGVLISSSRQCEYRTYSVLTYTDRGAFTPRPAKAYVFAA